MEMDPALSKAVEEGNVEFLKKAVANQQTSSYFLAQDREGGNIFHLADEDGNTPLYYALKYHCDHVVEKILGFVKEAVPVQPSKYFFAKSTRENVFHVAVSQGNVQFLREAMNILPTASLKQALLQTTNGDIYTVLHRAALKTDVTLVKCIIEMYASLSWDDEDHVKPWLALNWEKQTPLMIALDKPDTKDERCALEIMLMDPDFKSCTIADDRGHTPLYYAFKIGFNLVVQNILKFVKEAVPVQPSRYFFTEFTSENVFRVAADRGNVEFLKEAINILPTASLKQPLLQTTERDMYTVLHLAALKKNVTLVKCIIDMYALLSWVDDDHVKPWLALTRNNKTPLHLAMGLDEPDEKCVMEILLLDPELTSWIIADEDGNTPLYYALKNGLNLVAEKILTSPHPAISIISSSNCLELIDLAITNCPENVQSLLWEKYGGRLDDDGNTSLHCALSSKSTQEIAINTLLTYPHLCKILNKRGETPFFLAVKSGCEKVVDVIMEIDEPSSEMLRRDDGTTVLHFLSFCRESMGKRLLKKYWWLINLCDDHGKTALDYAKQANNAPWLVDLLSKPSLIQTNEEFNWLEACTLEEYLTVVAFVETCEDIQRGCSLQKDTPLHHIKLNTYKEYSNFLKNPSVAKVKNMTDHDGKTALHRALERKEIYFAKALLLDKEVQQNIPDYEDKTAMSLLADLCKEQDEWGKMFKLVTKFSTNYIQEETNLDQIRNTLSVVAALLATITFAAGFTLPGGLNSGSGEALLAKKAGFLVFLLADVYAMCTSMLVLKWLGYWSIEVCFY